MDPITIAMSLAQFVPQIIKWVSGSDKAADVAEKAIAVAQEVTGTKTGDDALQALKASPDAVLAYRKAILDQQTEFEKLAIEKIQIAAADRDSARKREVALNDWTPRILAFLIVGLYIAVQWFLLRNVVNEDMREMVMRALGTLDASLGLVLAYYFGSSSDMTKK